KECIELLKEADIVVTNPPFSLFREYVAQLMAYEKKFLIIGNMNAITYKEIFPLIKNNQLWLGPSITSGDRKFWVPDDYELRAAGCGIDETGRKFIRVKGVRWFTNLDHKKRHEELILFHQYSPEEYPKYDNYDAINVNATNDIPVDYDGAMGVPITFLDKYNPEQFEIIRFRKGNDEKDLSINGKCPYFRILIRKKK
ncbi:MAG: adenine-specific methyltransferase EcoRI family protein, partial [Prevotella sp.]|nr:adenine-specific methyltransferase EcoRI family protein [Prevotella sp.]